MVVAIRPLPPSGVETSLSFAIATPPRDRMSSATETRPDRVPTQHEMNVAHACPALSSNDDDAFGPLVTISWIPRLVAILHQRRSVLFCAPNRIHCHEHIDHRFGCQARYGRAPVMLDLKGRRSKEAPDPFRLGGKPRWPPGIVLSDLNLFTHIAL